MSRIRNSLRSNHSETSILRLLIQGRKMPNKKSRRFVRWTNRRFSNRHARTLQHEVTYQRVRIANHRGVHHGATRKPYRLERKGGAS